MRRKIIHPAAVKPELRSPGHGGLGKRRNAAAEKMAVRPFRELLQDELVSCTRRRQPPQRRHTMPSGGALEYSRSHPPVPFKSASGPRNFFKKIHGSSSGRCQRQYEYSGERETQRKLCSRIL